MSERRPSLLFDHVQVAVPDLAAAAGRFERDHGLVALPGGRHPGRGTANLIVPLGDSYLELISVVDEAEAAQVPGSSRVLRAIAAGRPLAAWAARTDGLDRVRAQLVAAGWALPGTAPGARLLADGTTLRWRMQELEEGAPFGALPFLIEWLGSPEAHPGRLPAEHRTAVRGFGRLRLTDPDPQGTRARLESLMRGGVDFVVEAGEPGVGAVVLDTAAGPLEVA